MSRKKGFTLIEVIVSIALLGIVAVGFLGVFNSNLNFLRINQRMTSDAFLDQKDMELKILQIKSDIADGTIPVASLTLKKDVFETGIDVKAYQFKLPVSDKNIYTLVTDTRLPEFEVPIAENVVAKLRKGTTEVSHAYADSSTNVIGSSSIDPSTSHVFMVNNYAWYASRSGFNIPMPNTPVPEIEVGNKYPKFPEDYTLIPTSTTINLNDVTAYGGRHIVFAVTPAAKSGKMGKTVPSNPVYISGLPQTTGTDLVLHLDASIIDNTDTSQIVVSGTDLMVQRWNDLSIHKKNANQTTSSLRPKLKEHPVGGDFVGKFVDFDASKNLLVGHDSLRNSTLNVFAVVRGNDSSVFYNNNSRTISASGESIGGSGEPWKIVSSTYTTTNGNAFNNITLGNSDVDIAELIVYKGTLSNDDRDKVMEYLREKYIPLVTVGEIIQLRPMTDIEVLRNTPYTLPFAVLAEMEYGSDRFVPVTWNPMNVNTSALGTFTFTATAVSDPTKSITLRVIVKDPVYVTSVNLNVNDKEITVGDSFKLQATVFPLDATNKAITWSSSNTSIASVDEDGVVTGVSNGTARITVRTADGNHTAFCDVRVLPPTVQVTGVTLNHSSVSLTVGDIEQLIATVLPGNATNKSVTWSSNNSRVSVDQNGRITANNTGTAIITVSTADGNYTATCTVTVTPATTSVTGVTLNKTSITLLQGQSEQLVATVLPESATNKSVTWSTSNSNLVSVNSNGRITAASSNTGTATITVRTADGGYSATCTVTVVRSNNVSNVTFNEAKFIVDVNSNAETSNKIIMTFAQTVRINTLVAFRGGTTFNGLGDISNVIISPSNNGSIIVTFENDIPESIYSGSLSGNNIGLGAIRNTNNSEVNITNGQNFTINGEVINYNTTDTQYRITTTDMTKAMDVEGSSTSTNTDKIIIYDNKNNDEANQLWYISNYENDITHSISWKPGSLSYYLRENGQNSTIRQNTNANSDSFKWIIERYRNTNGTIADYSIKPLNFSNRYLGVTSLNNVTYFRLLAANNNNYYRWMIIKK